MEQQKEEQGKKVGIDGSCLGSGEACMRELVRAGGTAEQRLADEEVCAAVEPPSPPCLCRGLWISALNAFGTPNCWRSGMFDMVLNNTTGCCC